MEHVDIYFFPDPTKSNATGQMADMVNFLVRLKWDVPTAASLPAFCELACMLS